MQVQLLPAKTFRVSFRSEQVGFRQAQLGVSRKTLSRSFVKHPEINDDMLDGFPEIRVSNVDFAIP